MGPFDNSGSRFRNIEMVIVRLFFLAIFILTSVAPLLARAEIAGGVLCTKDDPCRSRGIFTKRSPGPSKSDSVKVNPAEVPTEKITGIEVLDYKNSFDFALVKGLGRIGAAISPSNSDETFFGAPADENPGLFQTRMIEKSKYDAGKYALAAAVNLAEHSGSGFDNYALNLGLLGRYEVASQHVKPGVGVNAILGPVYGGASYYQDENQISLNPSPGSLTLNYAVTTYSGGLSLNSLLLDYSVLQVTGDTEAKATVITAAVFVSRFILTVARREVISQKPAYDFSTQLLYPSDSKVETFLGAQVRVAPFLVLGVFYNYYLLHEASFGATVFF